MRISSFPRALLVLSLSAGLLALTGCTTTGQPPAVIAPVDTVQDYQAPTPDEMTEEAVRQAVIDAKTAGSAIIKNLPTPEDIAVRGIFDKAVAVKDKLPTINISITP